MMEPFITKLQTAGELSADDLALLRDAASTVRHFPMRQDIIKRGDRPDCVNIIIEGWACRYQIVEDGSRQITAFMMPGDLCDTHVALFGAMDHSIAALTDATVARVSHARMRELLERPAIVRAFWWASLVDEAVLRAWIVNVGRRDALARVAHLICELHARLEAVGVAAGDRFQLPLTQEELSDALGLTSVHVNRTLRRLREAGLVDVSRREITISNMTKLRKTAGFDPAYLHLRNGKPLIFGP